MIRCLWLKSRSISPSVRFSSSSENVGVNRIRNIGIVAHVDAGKTTVTEQLLYLTGTTKSVGEVDSGSTVTDFLDMERERGITIQSAAVTFNWMQHRINLIDTPGHVDFTVEVERCLRVLDGIVTVLDGSAGVQAQTLTVWKQAQRFGLPAIFFVNKLDKKGADFKKTVDDVKQKLGVEALCTVIPKADFSGIIDLISGSQLSFNAGRNAEWQEIKEKTHDFDQLLAQRSDLCLEVAGQHEGFMEHFLEECSGQVDRVDSSALLRAIREVTLGGKAATVTCGSVLKSTSCARPILDHVVNFLPAPNERSAQLGHLFGDELAGFVFKVTHDKRRGHLCYVRVYNGTLKNNSSVFNSNQFRMEGPLKVFVPYADELRQAKEVGAGNIAVVAGLSHSVTGDSLLANQAVATSVNEKLHTELKQSHEGPDNHRKSAHDVYPNDSTGSSKNRSDSKKAAIGLQPREDGEGKTVVFSGIEIPDSVYFCCVEPPSTKSLHEFESALEEIAKEDPSLKVRKDKETGQTILETQGELHLEVIKDRLVRGYGLNVFMGSLMVAYREVLSESIENTAKVEEKLSEKGRPQSASVSLRVEPSPQSSKFKKVKVDIDTSTPPIRQDWLKAINEGCRNALHNGPLAGFPVHGIEITLTSFAVSGGRINPALLSACANKCLSEALQKGETVLVEPIMRVEVTVGRGQSTQPIVQELTRRRTLFESCDWSEEETTSVVGLLPLAEMEGLSRAIRTLTSGYGSLNVSVSDYQIVSDSEKDAILKRMRGT